ncbi:MAG: 3-phosphoshikimate 1-carboxyvinyltransferase [Bacteroidales bacterium]|nr:3-phosphoshikimate 1-carboxyvinyltransferase [Bacteroidales bacterium]
MIVRVNGPLGGQVTPPPSKSAAHRALICAALSDRPCTIRCDMVNDDIRATAGCLNALGAEISQNGVCYNVQPITTVRHNVTLDCRESGSTLRFLLPVTAALGRTASFVGSGRLPERPLSPLYERMVEHGAVLSPQGAMPLMLSGQMRGGTFRLAADVSSQFISGLLLALPLTAEGGRIELTGRVESAPYIDMTVQTMRRFGIEVRYTLDAIEVPEGQHYTAVDNLTVEGDWSGAAFWLAAGAAGTQPLTLTGLDYAGTVQGDRRMVDILMSMGAKFTLEAGKITAFPSDLHGAEIDCADTPDLVPILAVAAARAAGETRFTGVGRLRLKESDRLAAIVELLGAFGIRSVAEQNTLTVYGNPSRKPSGTPVRTNPHRDHRMAMAAAVMAAVMQQETLIGDAGCITKSYPSFYADFERLGGFYQVVEY